MNLLKLFGLLAAALFAVSVVYAVSAAEFTGATQGRPAGTPQETAECSAPNPEHVATIDQDSERMGFAFAVPDGPTFYAGAESWFLNFGNYAYRDEYFPLAESLATGFYVVRAEWIGGVPVQTIQLELTNPTGTSRGHLWGTNVDYLGSRILKWSAFQVRDRQFSVVKMISGGSQDWTVNIWKVDCLPWTLRSEFIW